MNITQHGYNHIHRVTLLLKVTYGVLFIVAGIDKFFNIIVPWQKYLSPVVADALPMSLSVIHLFTAIAVFELVVGAAILFFCSRIAAYTAGIWLLIIAANLISMHIYYDIAVRDIVMAVGVFALACLMHIKKEITQ